MKRIIYILSVITMLSLACSLCSWMGSIPDMFSAAQPEGKSEQRCGDGVCDGPENQHNCPADCSPEELSEPAEKSSGEIEMDSDLGILYHLTRHHVTMSPMGEEECYLFNFQAFLDGGFINMDGSSHQRLELLDHPTSLMTSKQKDHYYYVSSPENPVAEAFGYLIFNWDVDGQTLWKASYSDQTAVKISMENPNTFPGDVKTSPANEYLLYPLTEKKGTDAPLMSEGVEGKFDPFLTDSSLMISRADQSSQVEVLASAYNRRLMDSFGDFSPDGKWFYTLSRQEDAFQFIRINLSTGDVAPLEDVFPAFDWDGLNWNEFFPQSGDFSYAYFTISPDQSRIVAYKNEVMFNRDSPCSSPASHHRWVMNFDTNQMDVQRNREGYVTDTSWDPDSSQLAVALVGSSGCYPDYLDSWISLLDKDGNPINTLVEEPESKITNLGWAPDGHLIAYDVYGVDHIGRLNVIDPSAFQIQELVNTTELGYTDEGNHPVIIFFADWVSLKP